MYSRAKYKGGKMKKNRFGGKADDIKVGQRFERKNIHRKETSVEIVWLCGKNEYSGWYYSNNFYYNSTVFNFSGGNIYGNCKSVMDEIEHEKENNSRRQTEVVT